MSRRPLLLALIASLSLSAPLGDVALQKAEAGENKPAARGQPQFQLPETPLGRAVAEFVNAVSSDDPAEIALFVERNYVAKPNGFAGSESSREEAVRLIEKLRLQSGGLRPVNARGEEDNPNYLGVMFACKQREVMVAVEFFGSESEAGKIRETHLHVMKPPSGGPYQSWLELTGKQLCEQIEKTVDEAVKNDGFAGTVLVARGDEILLHRGYGMADAERGVPNSVDTIYNTASVGKMFTGVAIGQLVQRAKLKLSDKLPDLLPNYPDRKAAGKITLEHLLTHTSGLGDPLLVKRDADKTYDTPWSNIELFSSRPLAFEPGSRHEYSNGNYAVLAAIVERVSGQSYGDYVREHVFKPAGMQIAEASAEDIRRFAKGYANGADDPLGIEPKQPVFKENPQTNVMVGFGGVRLSAADLHRFFRALQTHKLLDAKTTEQFTSGKVQVGAGGPMRYGFGFYDINHGGTSVRGHSGGGGNMGFGAHAECLWDQQITIVVLGNRNLEHVRPLTMKLINGLKAVSK